MLTRAAKRRCAEAHAEDRPLRETVALTRVLAQFALAQLFPKLFARRRDVLFTRSSHGERVVRVPVVGGRRHVMIDGVHENLLYTVRQ
jgi:hypothetical protein